MLMAEKKKEKTKKAQNYSVDGHAAKRQNKFCPKCGPGVFLAEHKDRVACGNCGFTERKTGGK